MLEIDGTLLIAALSFVIFVFLMNMVFYRPVLEIIQKRRDYLTENENNAEKSEREAKNIFDKSEKLLNEGKIAANALIREGKAKSDKKFAGEKAEFIHQNNEEYEIKHSETLKSGNVLKDELQKKSDDISEVMKNILFGGLNV